MTNRMGIVWFLSWVGGCSGDYWTYSVCTERLQVADPSLFCNETSGASCIEVVESPLSYYKGSQIQPTCGYCRSGNNSLTRIKLVFDSCSDHSVCRSDNDCLEQQCCAMPSKEVMFAHPHTSCAPYCGDGTELLVDMQMCGNLGDGICVQQQDQPSLVGYACGYDICQDTNWVHETCGYDKYLNYQPGIRTRRLQEITPYPTNTPRTAAPFVPLAPGATHKPTQRPTRPPTGSPTPRPTPTFQDKLPIWEACSQVCLRAVQSIRHCSDDPWVQLFDPLRDCRNYEYCQAENHQRFCHSNTDCQPGYCCSLPVNQTEYVQNMDGCGSYGRDCRCSAREGGSTTECGKECGDPLLGICKRPLDLQDWDWQCKECSVSSSTGNATVDMSNATNADGDPSM